MLAREIRGCIGAFGEGMILPVSLHKAFDDCLRACFSAIGAGQNRSKAVIRIDAPKEMMAVP